MLIKEHHQLADVKYHLLWPQLLTDELTSLHIIHLSQILVKLTGLFGGKIIMLGPFPPQQVEPCFNIPEPPLLMPLATPSTWLIIPWLSPSFLQGHLASVMTASTTLNIWQYLVTTSWRVILCMVFTLMMEPTKCLQTLYYVYLLSLTKQQPIFKKTCKSSSPHYYIRRIFLLSTQLTMKKKLTIWMVA